MAVTDPIRAYCVELIARKKRRLELMENGTFLPGKKQGSTWIDTTKEAISETKAEIEEFERFVRELDVSAGRKPTR